MLLMWNVPRESGSTATVSNGTCGSIVVPPQFVYKLQAKYSTIQGFDFMGYSKIRLAAYYRFKDASVAMLERIPKPSALQADLD